MISPWKVIATAMLFAGIVASIASIVTASILVTHHQNELERFEATVAHCLNGGAIHVGERDFLCARIPKPKRGMK